MIPNLCHHAFALVLLAALPFAPAAAGAIDRTFVVTSTVDAVDASPGDGVCAAGSGTTACTVRAAVQEANALGGSTRIVLPVGVSYLLTIAGAGENAGATGDLDVTAPLVEIAGPPTGGLPILDGGMLDRVLDVATGSSLTLSRVVVRGGKAPSGEDGGGVRMSSVYTASILTLDQVEISGNSAAFGGGVFMLSGIVVDSRIVGNTASLAGGGLTIDGSALVLRSTFAGNEVNAAAAGGGSALYVGALTSDRVAIENSTLVENEFLSGALGGAILVTSGQIHLRNVTVARNFVIGGGAIMSYSGKPVDLWSSIVAETTAGDPPLPGCAGNVVLHGFDLLDRSEADCPVTYGDDSQGEQLGVDAGLGAHGAHGGFGSTVALSFDSPAIDQGDPAGCRDDDGALLATDQRGAVRPRPGVAGGPLRCDAGAYEFDHLVFTNGFESGNLSAWSASVP